MKTKPTKLTFYPVQSHTYLGRAAKAFTVSAKTHWRKQLARLLASTPEVAGVRITFGGGEEQFINLSK